MITASYLLSVPAEGTSFLASHAATYSALACVAVFVSEISGAGFPAPSSFIALTCAFSCSFAVASSVFRVSTVVAACVSACFASVSRASASLKRVCFASTVLAASNWFFASSVLALIVSLTPAARPSVLMPPSTLASCACACCGVSAFCSIVTLFCAASMPDIRAVLTCVLYAAPCPTSIPTETAAERTPHVTPTTSPTIAALRCASAWDWMEFWICWFCVLRRSRAALRWLCATSTRRAISW